MSSKNDLIVNEKSYDVAMSLLKINETKVKLNDNVKRTESNINYQKWEKMSQEIIIDEIVTNPYTKEILKLENKNDIRKQRMFFEKPYVSKLEACIVFKQKADQILKEEKDYKKAFSLYDYALSFLFITKYNEDEEMTLKQKESRNSIFMNISICLINLNDHKKALDYLNECLIYNPKNFKCIYRISHCYYSMKEYEKALESIEKGLNYDSNCQELLTLKQQIKDNLKLLDDERRKIYKKLIS